MNRLRLLLLIGLLSFTTSLRATASIQITATADEMGFNNAPFESNMFWGVSFTGTSSQSIQSFTIDLQAGTAPAGSFFDLDGASFSPIIGSVTGILPSEVSFFPPLPGPGLSDFLTVNFAPGSFTSGDSILFGADIDGTPFDFDGDGVGQFGVGFSASLSNSGILTTSFADTGGDNGISTAIITGTDPTSNPAVPEPTTFLVWTGLVCCGSLGTRRRRRVSHSDALPGAHRTLLAG